MNSNLKQTLEHIAQGVAEESNALSTLSDQVAVIESQQHEVRTETVRILSLIAEIVHEQGIFANEFNNLCRDWAPKFHTDEPVPAAISQSLRQWHDLFSRRVHYLTQAATSLVETTSIYKEEARQATSNIQVYHRDRILQLNMQITKIQVDCTSEAERLEAWRQRILSARDGLTREVSNLNGDIDQVQARIETQNKDKKGLGFGITGTGLGVIGIGLGTLCPPLGAAASVISITSTITGIVLTESKRSKLKELEKEVDKIGHRSQQINNEIENMNQESKFFKEQSTEVKTVHEDVQRLLENFSPIKEMAETLERASIQRCSISSSLSLRVSGILSSSTALEMVMSYENLMECAEAILSDFSYSTQEDRQPLIEWEISTPDHPANGTDNLALNQVLADLQTGLDEIKVRGSTMENIRLLEDRDDYHEMMKPRFLNM
ncbi:hypothetical protein FMUND_4418 [Fusarium mundagurra]|uniref:Uncharacterized protein n=1 Tax=Fusarium mundagurra TaxID=1567541 RepID=A0A8H5YW20_9HYPO|nr:hypothetical protein FMUND_4418 [Fusarium mundagurra]